MNLCPDKSRISYIWIDNGQNMPRVFIEQRPCKGMNDFLLKILHGRNLVYNACWEDPRIDRQLLELKNDSRILMITSAGCNALDYLLDNPSKIVCVDINPRQNYLLELKIKMAALLEYEDFWLFFGMGAHPRHREVLAHILPQLSEHSRQYWEKHQDWFNPVSRRGSFYFHGSFGTMAWVFSKLVPFFISEYQTKLGAFLNSSTLDEQRQNIPIRVQAKMIRLIGQIAGTRISLAMNGISSRQIRMIKKEFPGGLPSFITKIFNQVTLNLPVGDNYFWRVSLTGCYTHRCAPNYLKKENYPVVRSRSKAIEIHHQSVTRYLQHNPSEKFTHFVLLDHLDWMTFGKSDALAEEWRLILQISAPGARIIFRSAGLTNRFLPGFVFERVKFFPELAAPLHSLDRVGSYGSLHLGIVGG